MGMGTSTDTVGGSVFSVLLLCIVVLGGGWREGLGGWRGALADNPGIPEATVSISTERVGFSSVVLGDLVYVFGGFFHANQMGGDPVAFIDVYSVNGSFVSNSSLPWMPNPRGWMTVLPLNETFVLAIGGTQSLSSLEPMTVVDALELDPSNPLEGSWVSSWSTLKVPRMNATATLSSSGGVVVALGAQVDSGLVEYLSEGRSQAMPSLSNDCGGQGVLGTLDANGSVVLFCFDSTPSQTYVLPSGGYAWELLPETPLTPWTIQSITPVSYAPFSMFMADTVEHSAFLFTLGEGNMNQYVCYTGLACSGLLLYSEEAMVCVMTFDSPAARRWRSEPLEVEPPVFPQWQTLGGNMQRTGQGYGYWSCYPGFGSDLALKWVYPTGSIVVGSPSIGISGIVYIATQTGYLEAVSPDGSLAWISGPDLGTSVTSFPTVLDPPGSDEEVLIGSMSSGLLNIIGGGILWQTSGMVSWTSPTFGVTGFVMALTMGPENILSGLELATGATVWHYSGCYYFGATSPTLDDSREVVYVMCTSSLSLLAFSQATGQMLWEATGLGAAFGSSPVVGVNGTIFLGLASSFVYALSPEGQVLWSHQAGSMILSTPALSWDESTLYFTSIDNRFTALNTATGEIVWQQHWWGDLGLYVIVTASSPAVGLDGTIFVGWGDSLFAVEPTEGILMWNYTLPGVIWSSVALSYDGTIYAITTSGNLYAVNGNQAVGAWISQPLL